MMLGQSVVSGKRKSTPTVVLTEIADRRIFQRGVTNAMVPIAGTWAAGTAGIEARIINSDTLAEVVAWTTIVASPAGSTWSGTISVPQGGWYKIEVRRVGLTGSIKRSANRLGVGDVWLFAGHSQQERMSTVVGSPPAADALTVYANSNGLWQAPGEFSGTAGNGGIRFLNLMRQYTGVPQAMAQTASGASLTDWESGDAALINASARLQAIGTVKGVLWNQGGTGLNELTKADYKTKLAALRTALSQSGTFGLFGVFPLMPQAGTANSDADVQKIRQAHYEYIAENTSTVNLGWSPDVALSDDVNQTAAGSEAIAYAYAHALLFNMGLVAEQSIGPRITAVSRSGVTLTLTVVHNGGASLKTQTGATPTGFQVFPRDSVHSDGAALAISNVALAASAITITLAADPGAAVDVYYQYGKFDATAPVYDNSTALGRTVGNPLQPLMTPVQSAVEAQAAQNPAVQLNGVDSWIRYSDSVVWDLPDADWTMAVFASITSNATSGAQTTQYLLSGGAYAGANSFNFVIHEEGAGSGNANKIEFTVKGAGATTFTAKPAAADTTVVNATWRLWVVEFVKATETVNLYYCTVGGTRTLYTSIAAPGLGLVAPTVGPAIGTRAPPAVASGLYLNGRVYEFIKLNGLLSAAEVVQIANGKNVRTDLGRTTVIHTRFGTLTTPIPDASGTGLSASLNGPVTLQEGPDFPDPTTAVHLNGTDTAYTMADSSSFDLPDSNWTLGFMTKAGSADIAGTESQYLYSTGAFQASNSINVRLSEASATTNPSSLSVPMMGSGGVAMEVVGPLNAGLFSDNAYRLWTVERVKATETLNIYYTNINGPRTLYATGSTASLGSIQPPGGVSGVPTIGARAVSPAGRFYSGDLYMAFQANILLNQSQTESLAKGVDLVTGLSVSPSWYYKFASTAATLTDLSGNGNTATRVGTATQVTGPDWASVYTPPAAPEVFNGAMKGMVITGGNPWEWMFSNMSMPEGRRDVQLADYSNLGVRIVRFDLDWNTTEASDGVFTWTYFDKMINAIVAAGLIPLPIFHRTPDWAKGTLTDSFGVTRATSYPGNMNRFAQWCAVAVNRYKDRVKYWEIWNEPNLHGFWYPTPNANLFADMCMAVYTACKAADPNCVLISGGLSSVPNDDTDPLTPYISDAEPGHPHPEHKAEHGFLSAMYARRNAVAPTNPMFDHCGVHPYTWPLLPSQPENWNGWTMMADTNPSVRSIMTANGDSAKKIWMTEYGGPTGGGDGAVTDATLSAMVTESHNLAAGYSWAGPLIWYEYWDHGPDINYTEENFGLLTQPYAPKLAYNTYLKRAKPAANAFQKTYRQNVSGYTSTVDTRINQAAPTTNYATATTLTISTDISGNGTNLRSQGLLRFDNLFGGGATQVPLGAHIVGAEIRFTVTVAGHAPSFHRMLQSWAATDTWDSRVGGVSRDGIEAVNTPVLVDYWFDPGTHRIDVSKDLKAWSSGQPNFGWLIECTGWLNLTYSSAEGTSPPQLLVTYVV